MHVGAVRVEFLDLLPDLLGVEGIREASNLFLKSLEGLLPLERQHLFVGDALDRNIPFGIFLFRSIHCPSFRVTFRSRVTGVLEALQAIRELVVQRLRDFVLVDEVRGQQLRPVFRFPQGLSEQIHLSRVCDTLLLQFLLVPLGCLVHFRNLIGSDLGRLQGNLVGVEDRYIWFDGF